MMHAFRWLAVAIGTVLLVIVTPWIGWNLMVGESAWFPLGVAAIIWAITVPSSTFAVCVVDHVGL